MHLLHLGLIRDCRATFNALKSVDINTNLIDFSPNNLKNRKNNVCQIQYLVMHHSKFQ